jgi:hypothetical protein
VRCTALCCYSGNCFDWDEHGIILYRSVVVESGVCTMAKLLS